MSHIVETQAPPQRLEAFVIPARLPSLPPAESTPGVTIQCRLIDNTTADVLGDFPGNTNLTFCAVDVCRHCVGGFSNKTFCTSLWTRDPSPDRPCFSTGIVKSWSEIWLYWWPQDDTSDGYVVSWCGGSDESSHHPVTAAVSGATVAPASENCSTDVSGSSIALGHLRAFTKYVFSMRAYRWLDANKTERLFSRPLKSQPIVLINPRAALTPLEHSTRAATAAKKPHVPQATAASAHRAKKTFPRRLLMTPWRLNASQPAVIKRKKRQQKYIRCDKVINELQSP
ncbi:uncharacterized protein LOC119165638 [Rhipicephalus microplus]|uniref:uncharacterized protein LOC119165638 n=1 Tax=Rhipicephalus microplus TaxID=6941 RepID=UPI003F6B7D38